MTKLIKFLLRLFLQSVLLGVFAFPFLLCYYIGLIICWPVSLVAWPFVWAYSEHSLLESLKYMKWGIPYLIPTNIDADDPNLALLFFFVGIFPVTIFIIGFLNGF